MNISHARSVAAVVLALTLTACSKKPPFVLIADPAQIGQGTKISIDGDSGSIEMAPIPGWPAGLHEPVIGDNERPGQNLQGGYVWSLRVPGKNLTMSFIVVGKTYVCESCASLRLPLQWTRKST
jgi:hypothetical protein